MEQRTKEPQSRTSFLRRVKSSSPYRSNPINIRPTAALMVLIVVLLAINAYLLFSDGDGTEDFPPAQEAPEDLCASIGEDLTRTLVPNAKRIKASHRQWADEGWSECNISESARVVFLEVELKRFGDSEDGSASSRAKADFNQLCAVSKEVYSPHKDDTVRPPGFDRVCSLASTTPGAGATASIQVLDGPNHLSILYGAKSLDATKAVDAAYQVARAILT